MGGPSFVHGGLSRWGSFCFNEGDEGYNKAYGVEGGGERNALALCHSLRENLTFVMM